MPDPTGRVSHLPHFHRGMAWKEPVRVATTANITIATALNNGDSIDGVTLATGDRVLVKDQSTGNQNGIYVAGASPARAYDMDQDGTTTVPAEEIAGAFVYVIAGTANAGKVFHTTNAAGGTLGSTTITWTELSGGGGGAPTNADYLVGTANGSLSNEIVVGTTPGGELGGTWGSPTVDATHSGSAHVLLTANTPAAVSTSGAVGSGTASAKDDHVHAHEAAHIQHDTTWAAKGDLIAGTANDAASVLTVGSNDQVLVADSAQTTGMKWAAVSTVDPEGWTSIIASADEDCTDAQNQDHTQFQISTLTGKHYMLELLLLSSGNNTTGDFEYRFTATAGTLDGRGNLLNFSTGNAAEIIGYAQVAAATGSNIPLGVQGDLGFPNFVHIYFAFRQNTSNATVKFQFGNNAVSAGANRISRVMKGSIMRWKQVD